MFDELQVVADLGAQVPGPSEAAIARAEAALAAEIGRPRRRVFRWWREHPRRLLAGVVLPAALLAAGAGYLLTRPVSYATGVACYDAVSLNANIAVPGPGGPDPVATCAQVWREGAMRPGVSVAPAQTACVLNSGAVAVFPSGNPNTCARLGLRALPAAYVRREERIAALQSALQASIGSQGSSCVGAVKAAAIVRRLLAAQHFEHWTVRRSGGPFDQARPCAGVSLNDAARVIYLIPDARQNAYTLSSRRAFAGVSVPTGPGRSDPIDPATLELLNGNGAAAVFSMYTRNRSARCLGVRAGGPPAIGCTTSHSLSWWTLSLDHGPLLLLGTDTPGVEMSLGFSDHTMVPITVTPSGFFVAELLGARAGQTATLTIPARPGQPAATTTTVSLRAGAVHAIRVVRR